jgi:hypothetical protein
MKQRPFLVLWTLAVAAASTAFVLHLAFRGRTVELGYKLGKARAEQARLREVKRVLSLEAASYRTPQRVEMVARSLLGMSAPPAQRVIALRGATPAPDGDKPSGEVVDVAAMASSKPSASAPPAKAPPPADGGQP